MNQFARAKDLFELPDRTLPLVGAARRDRKSEVVREAWIPVSWIADYRRRAA
jgi:hypothetical protein